MKITREALKTIVKETMIEESEYQEFFKKALEKAGGSIPKMSEEEKKAFFNKIEKTWKGKGEKKESVNEKTNSSKSQFKLTVNIKDIAKQIGTKYSISPADDAKDSYFINKSSSDEFVGSFYYDGKEFTALDMPGNLFNSIKKLKVDTYDDTRDAIFDMWDSFFKDNRQGITHGSVGSGSSFDFETDNQKVLKNFIRKAVQYLKKNKIEFKTRNIKGGLQINTTLEESLEEAQSPAQKAAFAKMLAKKDGKDESETELEEAQSPAQKAAFAKMLAKKDGKKKDEKEEVKESIIKEGFAVWEMSFADMNINGVELSSKKKYKVKARNTVEAIKKAASMAGLKGQDWVATQTNYLKKIG